MGLNIKECWTRCGKKPNGEIFLRLWKKLKGG